MVPYRTRFEPDPELPDPAVEAYARRVAADRRRGGYFFLKVASLVALMAGALVAGLVFTLHTIPERRMTARWGEALSCFDDGSEGLRERIRARQLAAIGEESTWPSRCREPLHAFALAAAAANHHAVAESADDLARIAARADLENEDLVVPAATLINGGARIGLRAIDPVQKSPGSRCPPPLSELLASAGWTPPPYHWPNPVDYDRCLLDGSGHHLRCGVPLGQAVLTHWTNSSSIRDLPDGELGVQVCDDRVGRDSWAACPYEPMGIGRPPFFSVARLGTKLVVIWVPMGAVGGVRMRMAERGMLSNAKTRVIFDDRIFGDVITLLQLKSLVVIERGDYALILIKTVDGRSLALRLDASGELSTVPVSLIATSSSFPP